MAVLIGFIYWSVTTSVKQTPGQFKGLMISVNMCRMFGERILPSPLSLSPSSYGRQQEAFVMTGRVPRLGRMRISLTKLHTLFEH